MINHEPMVDILIPTFDRPAALAVTLTSLASQSYSNFKVIISDQSRCCDVAQEGVVMAAVRVLKLHGYEVEIHKNLPARGMAEQRQFLLNQARSLYVLFLDDDLILESFVIRNMVQAIEEEGCGFVGSALIGLSFIEDIRPEEQQIEFWEGHVEPETVFPGTRAWERYRLHNAANLYHLQMRLGLKAENQRIYRVAWVGGCVLYNAEKLREVGGFLFWEELPENHVGENVFAQQRVMARFGGCGVIPSGIYHQELPTTIPDREHNAPEILTAQETIHGEFSRDIPNVE